MNTRRYPRSMEEAFGPYCRSTGLQPMPDRTQMRNDRRTLAATIFLLIVAVVALLSLGGPSDVQAMRDVSDEVASLEVESSALQHPQHPSTLQPVRRRHRSVVVAQGSVQ